MKARTVATARPGTQLLCVFVQDAADVSGLGKLDARTAATVSQACKDMGGRPEETVLVHVAARRPAKRILLAGIGKKPEMTPDTIRLAAGAAAKRAAELGIDEFSVIVPPGGVADAAEAASQIVEGAKMSVYSFERFKGKKKSAPRAMNVITRSKKAARAVRTAEITADAAIFARDMANMPPNECTPAALARTAKKIRGVKCQIVAGAELGRRGFGGIAAVGGGSRNAPRLIILEHMGGPKGQRPVVLVGKAVTFDTGGISLKPRERMDEMKFDKCGGCAVLGILKAASEMKIGANIVGIIPSVENMPGGGAYRPGDIIKLYGGKTAEILNTDAEGRLILADALAYGEERYSPRAIIDFATLTGACIVALGTNVAAMVSNNDRLAGKISESSARTAEEVWRLPINRDYMDMIKSDVADMKNIGIGTAAGSITAAAFLKNAIKDTPWAHIDIAGVAWTQASTRKKPYNPKGATGFGVRLALDYLQNL